MARYTVTPIDVATELDPKDIAILEGTPAPGYFIPFEDQVKAVITDISGNLYESIDNFTLYTVENDTLLLEKGQYSQVKLDFDKLVEFFGLSTGDYIANFTFYRPLLGSSSSQKYFISEVSSDGTEVELNGTLLDSPENIQAILEFQQEIRNSKTLTPFYLEFSTGVVSAVNLLYTQDRKLLIKLYQPLPANITVKDLCKVYLRVGEPVAYQLTFEPELVIFNEPVSYLKSPNFNLDTKDKLATNESYQSLTTLLSTYSTSSLDQIKSILEEKDVEVNVDYTDFSNFIHFSSAKERVLNFYVKVSAIEYYKSQLGLVNSITGSTSASFAVSQSRISLQNSITNYIEKFDGFEYHMYYESSSYAWPKTNTSPPYTLYSTSSVIAQTWLNTQLASASFYDDFNSNNLTNTLPEYIRQDNNNAPGLLLVNMLGQLLDVLWLYTKGVTDKLNADNRSDYGAPKKLMGDILRSLGISTYESQFSNQDLFTAFTGLTPDGQLNYPTGSEKITQYVTASRGTTIEDYQTEIYKRLYHNLPLLLKKKGTVEGMKLLLTLFGVPSTILRVNEYGGKDKNNANDWDYWYDEYNYAYKQNGNNFISSFWMLNSNWASPNNVPATLMFRFKTNGLPTSNIPYSQSLWIRNGANTSSFATGLITLSYSGSGYTSASYSGSIIDPYYQYATLSFIPDYYTGNGANSASIYLPFFNGGWWSVMITSGSGGFNLYSKNSIYNGYDGNQIGFQASSSISGYQNGWMNDAANSSCSFGKEFTLNIPGKGSNWANFSGSFQEIRYYNTAINESVFDDYVMNPNSIEGNGINQSPNQLAFRASLGGELYTALDEPTWVWNFYNSRSNAAGAVEETVISCLRSRYDYLTTSERYIGNSIHPKVTGSWNTTQSFNTDSLFIINSGSLFTANSQSVFFDQFPAGIKNPISDKIKLQNTLLPYSSSLPNIPDNKVLSTFDSIQQDYPISQSYTRDVNYVEVAFSPQNEINDDITSQIGFFNMGEYIGDPRLVSSSAQSYPDLDSLRNNYFQKYTQNYNYNDFIRLIKYFDNSLFKLLKDFAPARVGLSTGVVIKQHLLERNKYPTPQATTRTPIATQGSGSSNVTWNAPFTFQDLLISGAGIQMYTVTGSNAGSFPNLEGRTSGVILPSNYSFAVTQSWGGANIGPSGSIPFVRSTQEEFYSGELSGSVILVTDGDLNGSNPFLNPSTVALAYTASYYNTSITPGGNFLDRRTSPNNGEIYLLYDTGSFRGVNPNSPKFSGF